MGFATGFTGGVAVTLGATYLALRAHQHNRDSQSEALRAQAALLDSTMPRSTRRRLIEEQEYQRQLQQNLAESGRRREPHLVETAKERWNREVSSFAHWVQRTDWDDAREALEDNVARVFYELGGEETVARGKEKVARGKDRVVEAAHVVEEEAKDRGSWLWSKAENATLRAKDAEGKTQGQVVETKKPLVDQTKTSSWSLFGKPRDTASSPVGATSAAAGSAAGKVAEKTGPETPVQRALRERYEHPSGLDKTVSQALEERYTPLDRRDDSTLRGVQP